MSDDEMIEDYNNFIKEYGLRESWRIDDWDDWDDWDEWVHWDYLFCKIKTCWKSKPVMCWREEILKQFVHSLPNVSNPTALFHVFIQSDAFYLPQILSLIELHDTIHLRWEIGTIDEKEINYNTDEIEKFRCGLLRQGDDPLADYYSKLKRCNDIVRLCKEHFEEKFYSGLLPKYLSIIFDFNPIPPLDILINKLTSPEK